MASSTRIVTIAAYIISAHMAARAYYTKMYDYSEENSTIEDIMEIPVMAIQPPGEDQIRVLRAIDRSGPFRSLKDMIQDGLNREDAETAGNKGVKKYNYEDGTIRNKYSKVISSLEKAGFVETERLSGTKKKIRLTSPGKIVAEISDIFEKRT